MARFVLLKGLVVNFFILQILLTNMEMFFPLGLTIHRPSTQKIVRLEGICVFENVIGVFLFARPPRTIAGNDNNELVSDAHHSHIRLRFAIRGASSSAKRRCEVFRYIARLDGVAPAKARQPATDLLAVIMILGAQLLLEAALLVEHDE